MSCPLNIWQEKVETPVWTDVNSWNDLDPGDDVLSRDQGAVKISSLEKPLAPFRILP